MGFAKLPQAGRTTYQADIAEMARAFLLQLTNGGGGAPAGGEHGIDDEDLGGTQVGGEFKVVALRAMGLLVAIHADVADAGIGKDLEHAIDETEPGPQDRGDDDGARQGGAGVGRERSLDGALDGLEIAGDLESHERGQFPKLPAEHLRGCGTVADDGQFHPDQGVIDKGDALVCGLVRHAGSISKPARICRD